MHTQNILGAPDATWKSPYTQQGDCILKKCGDYEDIFTISYKRIPNDAKPIPGNLVLKGQTNSHALYGGRFQLLEHGGVLFIRVDEATVLDHVKDHTRKRESAEHHAQWIPRGEYFFDGVLEYDHIKEESRQVVD